MPENKWLFSEHDIVQLPLKSHIISHQYHGSSKPCSHIIITQLRCWLLCIKNIFQIICLNYEFIVASRSIFLKDYSSLFLYIEKISLLRLCSPNIMKFKKLISIHFDIACFRDQRWLILTTSNDPCKLSSKITLTRFIKVTKNCRADITILRYEVKMNVSDKHCMTEKETF